MLWIEGGYAKRFGSLKVQATDKIDPVTEENLSLKKREQELKNSWLKNFENNLQNKKPMTADEYEKSLNK